MIIQSPLTFVGFAAPTIQPFIKRDQRHDYAIKILNRIVHRSLHDFPGCSHGVRGDAVKTAFVVIPKEPDADVIRILYGPWLSVGADESRRAAYRELVAHMLKYEGREFSDTHELTPRLEGKDMREA